MKQCDLLYNKLFAVDEKFVCSFLYGEQVSDAVAIEDLFSALVKDVHTDFVAIQIIVGQPPNFVAVTHVA